MNAVPTDPPFLRWKAFHFHLTAREEFPERTLADLALPPEVPETLRFRDLEAGGVTLVAEGSELDLFRLTVPRGFLFRTNLAVLFAELDVAEADELHLSAGADWHMAWFCNGRPVFDTFRRPGNVHTPPSALDYDFRLPLGAGRNVVALAVLSGAAGFNVHVRRAPADLAARREAEAAAQRARRATLRAQLQRPAQIRVRADRPRPGIWHRPERHQSISARMARPDALRTWLREVGRPEFVRCFQALHRGFLTEADFSPGPAERETDDRLRALSAASDALMVPLPLEGTRALLDGTLSEDEYRRRLVRGLEHLLAVAPNARWIEAFNESEAHQPPLDDEAYYRTYAAVCRAVADFERIHRPDAPLLVGGPTPCSFNRPRIRAFLGRFAADSCSAKRLDFLAHHQYLFRREHHPDFAAGELATLRGWCRELGLPSALPVHVNETGIFPVHNGTTDFADDFLVQAAGSLALHHAYLEQGPGIRPYQWTWLHPNPRKNLFLPSREALDRPVDPDEPVRAFLRPFCDRREDRFTPFGHSARLLAQLPDALVETDSSPRNDEGLGLRAIAAVGPGHLAVLAWNYQWTAAAGERPEYVAACVLEGLRAVLPAGPWRLRHYRIDRRHSHFAGLGDELLPVEDRTVDACSELALQLQLPPNAIVLARIDALDRVPTSPSP